MIYDPNLQNIFISWNHIYFSSYKSTEMESNQEINQFSKFIRTLTNNIAAADQFHSLKNAILLL